MNDKKQRKGDGFSRKNHETMSILRGAYAIRRKLLLQLQATNARRYAAANDCNLQKEEVL